MTTQTPPPEPNQMRSAEELLPCPFCGGKALMNERIYKPDCPDIDSHTKFRAVCGNCSGGMQSSRDTEKEACDLWNTRIASYARVPDGWQLVPIYATKEMIEIGKIVYRQEKDAGAGTQKLKAAYTAMLAAAPTPQEWSAA